MSRQGNVISAVRKANRTFWGFVLVVVKYFLLSVLVAAIYYAIVALLVSTDSEKQMKSENRLYEKVFPGMLRDEALVETVLSGLQVKDARIYKDIFYAEAPGLDPVGETDFLSSDTIPDRKIVKFTAAKADALLAASSRIDSLMKASHEKYCAPGASLPPLYMPVADLSYVQVGASIGEKMNPFLKVTARHDGLDIIASQGAAVYASAAGRVSLVRRSFKGEGNVVEITHDGGYVTRYCHLGDISVHLGQSVKAGTKIAEVGSSGNSLVPHLHYEVLRDGVLLDPVHHFFASVTPYEYTNMLYMSVNTGQSLD